MKNNEDFSTEQIYAITAHEIAHAAHWKLIVDAPSSNRFRDFQSATLQLLENWATYMETQFTEYFVNPNYDRWPRPGYEQPQYRALSPYSDFFNEIYETTTYTIIQMEQALIKANSLEEWKNNLKELYDGEETKLEEIFSKYYTKN